MEAALRNLPDTVTRLAPATEPPAPAQAKPVLPAAVRPDRLARWFRLHRAQLRGGLLGLISLGIFVALWQVLTANHATFYVRFTNVPSPAEVLARAILAFHNPVFGDHIWMSCRRILYGFTLASLVAIPLGLLMGRFQILREIVFPICEVTRPIPAIAWVPMAIMLWPTNEESIVFITFLGSFFPILINTLQGMATVDPVLVRAARCLGAKEASVFREVYLPASLPQIFTGLTVGMGVAWVSLIAAEMISGQFGIGYFTWEAYSLVQYSDIALGMITIGVLGLASSFAIRLLGRVAMPWGAAR
ncbi:ABC transporter permease [Methylobacterium gnaphalii]|uniref:ABC transporter permease n=1 Tax=Methylobacterium gnaphalii TaxID=1010610 RepID=A0A512JJN3_9HYPH|nr:ABC transporter permease [Methylobacterium gnaphalii]GEP10159.1 ABC transporter permease [Methylobacterium gnaphalii]GJD69532.1 Bicarbonate transport system permease protein CmpB [Methylobacterium gnaphalii]GLS48675.1 ABC transporter permease [Methylobacterium gnaphalii]